MAKKNKNKNKGGALGSEPQGKFQVGADMDSVQNQIARTKEMIAKKGGNAPNLQARLQQLEAAAQNFGSGQPEEQAPSYEQVDDRINTGLNETLQGIQDRAPFDPSQMGLPELAMSPEQWAEQRQRAEQVAMESFDRQMGPQFEKQKADFERQMAAKGVPANSELYNRQFEQMMNSQNSMRQNAMSSAFESGRQEQEMGFNQAMAGRGQMFNENTMAYQMPYQQMAAYAPFYQQGQQQQWLGNQQGLDRQHQFDMLNRQGRWDMRKIAATPRGGGGGYSGLPFDQLKELEMLKFNNQLVGSGYGGGYQQGGGYGGGFVAGVGAGAGQAITNQVLK